MIPVSPSTLPGPARVCAVVVTYQPETGFRRRLDAIRAQCEQVIVVDNGSPDWAAAGLPAGIQLLRQERNIGLAPALNLGLARARELGFAWAVTFDQDSSPAPGMVAALWATRARQPEPERVAVVGPRVREERCPEEDLRAVVPHPRCRWLFHRPPGSAQDLTGVAFVITSGALLDLGILARIGPMDDRLFIDYVDHDYCLRARQNGYEIVVSGAALLTHNLGAKQEFRLGGSIVRPTFHPASRLRYIFRNRVTLWRRYAFRFPHWAAFEAIFTPYNLTRILIFEDQRRAKLLAALRGTWDGVLGRDGPISS